MDEDELQKRLEAHRSVFAAIAMVMADITPGAMDAVIVALATFEDGMRARNYDDAMIDEIRAIRVRMTSMVPSLPPDPFPGTPPPRGRTDRS